MAGLFNDIKNKALNAALNIADQFTPVLKESKFRETGFITPEEFVAAGDFLTGHCPTWQWAHVAHAKACKDYLPRERQFLVTKNVPCSKRCRHLMDSLKDNQERVVEEETGDGGWVDTHFSSSASGSSALTSNGQLQVDMIDVNEENEEEKKRRSEKPLFKSLRNDENEEKNAAHNVDDEDADEDDDDEEAIDMDDYDHNVRDDNDDATTVVKPQESTGNTSLTVTSPKSAKNQLGEGETEIFSKFTKKKLIMKIP